MIEIYTDGSARDNGKENSNGGFGVVAIKDNTILFYERAYCENTTNNAEELKAIIFACSLARTLYYNEQCIIYTDSSYCEQICNNWIYQWAKNNWKRNGNKNIKNLELIKDLYKYLNIEFFNCQIKKCNGHSGIVGNELADALATNRYDKFCSITKNNSLQFDKLLKI